MNLFNSSYYKVQKTFLTLCGAWPYHTNYIYLFLRIIFITGAVFFMVVPEMIVMVRNLTNYDVIMSCLPMLTGSLVGFCKGIVLFYNSHKVKILWEELSQDWKTLKPKDLSIIEGYAEKGRLVSIAYACCIYSLVICYYLLSFVSPALDIILPLNESRHRTLIFPGEFYVRTDDHFFLFLTMEFCGILCAAHLLLTLDTLYMTLMLHSCGMFVVLSRRLEKVKIKKFGDKIDPTIKNNLTTIQDQQIYFSLSECIKLHLKCIKFGERLNSTFGAAFVTDLAFGVLGTSTSAVKFVLSINEPNQRLRYGLLYVVQSIRIFCNSFPGQLLSDYSRDVKLAMLKSEWYKFPEQSKKLLLVLMIRVDRPIEFTVGKVFTMNVRFFTMVTRTCLSYCTVMLSAQKN
ncbi:odorant receptor Or2-like [Prorops nasuta]|uniref:odorant receptor Or2-like n=1 Tax=Prorops nasuta TaxID=863751 RepID=UPI0034D00569